MVVEGVRQPAADKGGANVRRGVDEADDELVVDALGGDAEGGREVEVRAVGARLVPALDGGADGAGEDGQQQRPGNAPLVQDLVAQGLDLVRAQSLGAGDVLVARGVLGDQRALADEFAVVLEVLEAAEVVDVGQQRASRDADEWVLDSKTRGKRGGEIGN